MKLPEIAQHKYIVFGAARSGIAAAKLLRRHGRDVIVADEKNADAGAAARAELSKAGIQSFWGQQDAAARLAERKVMILSPGIPAGNAFVQHAKSLGARVISEIELASAFVSPAAHVIAVTGTNGKTTTTAWIAHLLQAAGKNAVLGGNIGEAWSNSVDSPHNQDGETVFVIETSSFQLEALEDFHPHVAVLTNLAPDHLDRYDGYADYVAAKRNILRNMTANDGLVMNADNEASREFAAGSAVRHFEFSTQRAVQNGAYVRADGMMGFAHDGWFKPLAPARGLLIPGRHNMENALAAAMAASLTGAGDKNIVRGLLDFKGVEHRIELCGELNGVRFYNDSKATNVDSLEKALMSFEVPVVLIAGGRDKHSDYDVLRPLVKQRVKHLVSLGEAAPLIEKSWEQAVTHTRAKSMQDAVEIAAKNAAPGHVVLLSPACASYDMYNNYEERGQDFKARVRQLIGEQ